MPSKYTCYICSIKITDHVYQVQRRTIRPVQYNKDGSPVRHDAIQTWHDGVILGPEVDDYCPVHFKALPTIQDLLDDYKRGLPTGSPVLT